jgi:hypothetical protein
VGLAFSVANTEAGTWVVGTDRNIYQFGGTPANPVWSQQTTDRSAQTIAAAQNGDMWALDANGNVGQVNHSKTTINYGFNGRGTSIAVSSGNAPYVADTNGALREWNGSTWLNFGGVVHQVTVWDVAILGTIVSAPYAVDTNDTLRFYNGSWGFFSPSPGTVALMADHVALVNGEFFEFNQFSNAWLDDGPLPFGPSNIVQISAAHRISTSSESVDSVWMVDDLNQIWVGTPPPPPPIPR